MKLFPFFLSVLVLIAAAYRLGAWQDVSMRSSLVDDHPVSVDVFDSGAAIILAVGDDRAAGRVGVDDDFNGVVDDAGELGAVGSDDLVLTPLDPTYDSAMEEPSTRVIARGAFRLAGDDDDLASLPKDQVRRVYSAVINGRHRVWFRSGDNQANDATESRRR